MLAPEKLEDWSLVLTAETLDDGTERFCDPVKLFSRLKGEAVLSACGVEFRIEVTNGGTDPVAVKFYRTPEGASGKRAKDSMGSTLGDWDHTITTDASNMRSSRRLDYRDCGSGVTCSVARASGTSVNMVVNVYARRDTLSIHG